LLRSEILVSGRRCFRGHFRQAHPIKTLFSQRNLSIFFHSARRYQRIIEMRPAVISAWQHDVAASAIACLDSTSPPSNPLKRVHLFEETASPPNQQSPKRRRIALSNIVPNPQNMSANAKDRPPRKKTRTPSPQKRGKYIPDDIENQLGTPRARPHLLPHCFDPPSSYQEALVADQDEPEPPQRRSPSRRAPSDSDAPSTSKRSASPVKRVAALQDVGGGIFYQELSDNGAELGTEGQKLF
jgi:hypothetical protein